MKISFDLDETLILSDPACACEQLPWYLRLLCREKLRHGTIALANELQKLGFEISIYTTSLRSEGYIRRLFRAHGIKLDQVINADRHALEVQGKRATILPSKMPSKYGIHLHIDDEIVVKQNGYQYGFSVLQIAPDDENWVSSVLTKARYILHSR
jgi:hypothetical protein